MQLWANADPKKRGDLPKPPTTPWTSEMSKTRQSAIAERLADLAAREQARRGVGD